MYSTLFNTTPTSGFKTPVQDLLNRKVSHYDKLQAVAYLVAKNAMLARASLEGNFLGKYVLYS